MNDKTAFIIPCYNEQDNINDLIDSCKDVIQKSNDEIEFVLVNNGSKDLTANLIKQGSSAKIHFVNIDQNIGMGNGIRKGLEYAIESKNYKNLGWTHADLQIPQESLLEALKILKYQQNNSKNIYIRGRRRNRNNFDIIFTFLMACYTTIVKRGLYYDITGLPVLINDNLINKVLFDAPNGFAFDVFSLKEFFNFAPRIWGFAAENLVLVALPTFIVMGIAMERSGVAEDLLHITQILLRKVPGGLAMSVTVMGTILAAMTGIIGASVTMMTALALPTMLNQKYYPSLALRTVHPRYIERLVASRKAAQDASRATSVKCNFDLKLTQKRNTPAEPRRRPCT